MGPALRISGLGSAGHSENDAPRKGARARGVWSAYRHSKASIQAI